MGEAVTALERNGVPEPLGGSAESLLGLVLERGSGEGESKRGNDIEDCGAGRGVGTACMVSSGRFTDVKVRNERSK